MRNDEPHPQRRGSTSGFYSAYLRKLAERRAARGEPPAPENCPDEYWDERRRNEALKELPPKKAA